MFDINFEHLCEVEVFADVVLVGPSSWGTRVIFPLTGDGSVKGLKLNGRVRPVGGDWGVIRADRCFELDVRMVIETDDGAAIYTHYPGIVALTREQAEESLLLGGIPSGLDLFVTPRFETGHDDYQWLTRIQAVGRGTVELTGEQIRVTYSWYALTP